MKFSFEIETPASCVECRFHELKTDGRYGRWVFLCLIDSGIKINPKDGLHRRVENCPGIVEEKE